MTYPNADAQSYTYDAMGNRLTKVHNAATTSYVYDDADQMTAAGGVTHTYDNNGNQTAAGADTFAWDAENRMTGTTIGGTAGTYAYNGDGLRMSRTIGGGTVTYTWDQNGGLPQILKDSGGNRYVYGLDLISKTDSGGAQEYYLTDGLGSTTGLATGTGTVTDSYTYDVFGAQRSHTGTSGNEFTYAGEQVDASGLQYLRARYYDAANGRFASRDPLPLMQRYAYVGGNPVNAIDPTGLCSWIGCLADAGECVLNRGDCISPMRLADPLIEALPEGRLPIGRPHLSYQLLATCVQYRDACAAGAAAAVAASVWTRKYYGAFNTPEGTRDVPKEGDAFTHCYWSGLITLQVGAGKAERVTTRFEAYGSENNRDERQYDQDNNQRGREYAQRNQALGPAAEPALRDYCKG